MFRESTHTTESYNNGHVSGSRDITAEVDALLKKNGVTRDQVTTEAIEYITEDQIRMIQFLAKTKHIADVNAECHTYFISNDADIEALTAKQADKFIRHLHSFTADGTPPKEVPSWVDQLGEDFKVARETADDVAPEFVDFPTDIIRSLAQENNKLTKRDVESVLADFRMNVDLGEYQQEAMSLFVTDISDKAGMAKARELRLIGKRERVRFDEQGKAVKEPYLRRTQLIDGVRRDVRQKFQLCESHLQEQEDFEKIENARIAAEKQTARIEELAQFEWLAAATDVERSGAATELTIGYMSDDQWSVFRAGVESEFNTRKAQEGEALRIKQLEDERLTRENAALRLTQARAFQLLDLGFRLDGNRYSFEDIRVDIESIKDATDDEWTAMLASMSQQVGVIKAAQQAIKDRADMIRNRTGSLTSIGMFFDGERFTFEGHLTYTLDEVTEAGDAVFGEIVTTASQKIMDVRLEQRRLQDEQARIAKAAADEEAAAKLAAMAPDKDKIVVYTKAVHDAVLNQPEVADHRIQEMLASYFDSMANLTNAFAKKVADLPAA